MKKILLAIMLILLTFNVFALTNNENPAYLLEVSSSTIKPNTIYPGDTINIGLNIHNQGKKLDSRLENIQLTLEPNNSFIGINTEQTIASIRNDETRTVVFQTKAKDEILSGTYTFTLSMDYTTQSNARINDKYTFGVTISDRYKVEITQVTASNYSPHLDETITLMAIIENTGSIEARNVTAELRKDASSTFGNFIVLDETKLNLEHILPNETATAIFKIIPSKKVTPGVYAFAIDADCFDCTAENSSTEKFSLNVLGRPNLIISGIDLSSDGIDEKRIRQGDPFSLSIQLDNIGEEQAKTVSVELITSEKILGPKTSYVGSIDEDDSGAAIFDLSISPQAQQGEEQIEIIIKYLDELELPRTIKQTYPLFIHPAPPPDVITPLILLIILGIVGYFIAKMIFRQLAIRRG